MKGLFYIKIVFAVVAITMIGAMLVSFVTYKTPEEDQDQSRMRVRQTLNTGGTIFYILVVDGKEYLAQKEGGIIRLRD